MPAAFDCPKCGAPLSFEPHPGDETVECAFCHETVIIPKELRVPLPRVVYQPPPPVRSSRPSAAIIAIVGVVLVAVCVAIFIIANPSDQSTTDFPTDTSSVLSPADSATATFEAQATSDALQPILALEQAWSASFTEPFTDNSHNWRNGDVRDSYISGNRSISGGTYSWNITAVQSTSDFSFPDMPETANFYASVDMKLISMPDDPDADAGMAFRYNSTDGSWYYFSVNNQGQYYFGWYNGSDWETLIPETDSAAILIGQTNRLTVGVRGSQFIFLINGQLVDHFVDDNLKSGTLGLGLNLPQTGEKATVEFSNFTVLSPTAKP